MKKRHIHFPELLLCACLSGCGLGDTVNDIGEDIDDGIDDVTEQSMALLRDLYPDLSDAEIMDLSADLSMEDILALQDELGPIREEAARLSDDLFVTAEEMRAERDAALADLNNGFPLTIEPIGRSAFYNSASGDGRVVLSGVFRSETGINLTSENISLSIDGTPLDTTTRCLYQGETVDIVFLLDVTGSMSNVIASVRESIVSFVNAIASSGLQGTIGLVSYQDSVGVDVTFQEPAPPDGTERSPFFAPVPINDAAQVEALKSFINRLEANQGYDAPENLSGAIDFARNNVIGYTGQNSPNVIGAGSDDPPNTSAFPALKSDRQIFVAFTDVTYHADSRDETNSSLLGPFVPRDSGDILTSLLRKGTIVNVSDPSWVDQSTSPTGDADEVDIDADYWAMETGGVGEDIVAGYSLVDLELVITASDAGLLDITLDSILQTTCFVEFNLPDLSLDAAVSLTINEGTETFEEELSFEFF